MEQLQQRVKEDCSICLQPLILPYGKSKKCDHEFHFECIKEWWDQKRTCPLCRIEVQQPYIVNYDYVGEKLNFLPHGQGMARYLNGSHYIGAFKKGELEGYGLLRNAVTGSIYEGREKLGNGAVYIGTFKNNSYNGQGKITWPTGDIYIGNFKNNLRDGYGKFKKATGFIAEGQWDQGIFSGKRFKPNENVYQGQKKDNVPHGKGRLSFRNGDIYIGDLREGECNGSGKYIWKDGSIYEGRFLNNKKHGEGYYQLVNGKRTKHLWENGKHIKWIRT